ncbi:MAG TPA: class E sortase [Acidimicrobiales bacterium]|nr:class E sortase [Acidimicrobiales bacterium]
MRGRSVIVPTVVLLLAVACSPATAPPPAAPARTDVPSFSPLPAAPASTYGDPTAPRAGPPLPEPINIPADPYAPEPVVEIGTMEIPAIGLVHRIFEGVTLNNIDRGPSLWTGSALPGQMGNTVFAGHRTTHDEPFRRIDELKPGDPVIFRVGGATTTYRVTGHMVVSPADSWIADQTTAYTGTLYACHPLGSTAQRYVVQLALAT